jgi:predicted nucleotidyltransferase component of viral defense system
MASRDYHEDVDLFRDAVSFTQSKTGFSERLIEKDYFCSVVLDDLSSVLATELAFKGGTSLSKVHGDFYRLSEDLDFGISTPINASRSQRSKRMAALKRHWASLPKRAPCLKTIAALRGYNNSTQYIGQLGYRSPVTGEEESIKVEVSVREPIVEPVRRLPARTLLIDPFRGKPVIDSVAVAAISRQEAYAEKLRAALSRREPAIRDFYDVDHALRAGWIDPTSWSLVELVRQKLAVSGDNAIDVSGEKLQLLRKQLEKRLKPVLRETDFARFDLDRAHEAMCQFAERVL